MYLKLGKQIFIFHTLKANWLAYTQTLFYTSRLVKNYYFVLLISPLNSKIVKNNSNHSTHVGNSAFSNYHRAQRDLKGQIPSLRTLCWDIDDVDPAECRKPLEHTYKGPLCSAHIVLYWRPPCWRSCKGLLCTTVPAETMFSNIHCISTSTSK